MRRILNLLQSLLVESGKYRSVWSAGRGIGQSRLLSENHLEFWAAKFFAPMSAAANLPRLTVEHDTTNGQFFIILDEKKNQKAVLDYAHLDKDTVDLFHTGVPVEFRGKGVAQVLTKAALDYVVSQNFHFRPTCSYVQNYVSKNPSPEFTSLLVGTTPGRT